jgi:hypothetical protein
MKPPRPVNDTEVLADLDRQMAGYGNGRRLADKLDMEPSHLRSMRSGSTSLGRRVAEALGWELRWVRKDDTQ